MYIQRNFGVYCILSSNTGPNRIFVFIYLFIYFFFQVEVEFEFDLSCFVFLLTAMRVGKQTSND